ncbi:MAG: DUF481 domain-containing protein [Congregibacter sp.]
MTQSAWLQRMGLGLLSLRILLVLLIILALLGVGAPAEAHSKTDVITLLNGDRITCEIKSLQNGRLSASTDSMGTVDIEWKEIATVDSNYNYEMRLNDGQRFFGSLGPGSVPGSIHFVDVFGERDLNLDSIVELRPVEDSFASRTDIYLSANYAFTKASGVTQTEFRANMSYENQDALNALTSRLTVSDTDDESTASSRINLSRKVWTDREAMFRLVFAGHETNDELALDYRITLGAGIGKYFIDTNRQNLVASFGLQALEEKSLDGDSDESIEAVLSAGYSRWRYDSPKLNLLLDASLYPSLTESGRLRADSAATLRWEIIRDLYWDVSTWGSYDNSTIDATASEFDWGITTGLGWEF